MIKPSDSKLDLGFFTRNSITFASDEAYNSMWYLKELTVRMCACMCSYACVHLLYVDVLNQKLVD